MGPKECWPWIGEKTYHGYGRFTLLTGAKNRATRIAHRMAWEYSMGPIPKGLECCHHCDNRPCCNPRHLFIGTHKDNMEDAINKGRLWAVHGDKQGSAKLTDKKVASIRAMYIPGIVSMKSLANLFGVSEKAIFVIIHRQGWKHVP